VCYDGQVPVGNEIDLSGTELTVTDNYELPACQKSVFVWSASPDAGGNASLIAHLYKVGSDRSMSVANELAFDVSEPLMGETLIPLSGGVYYLNTENLNGTWAIRWECRDGQAPVGSEVDVSGDVHGVTDNYELPACQKSVFSWQVEPDEDGTASLILHLHKVGDDRYDSMVNELEFDTTGPLEGEALQALSGGTYYLSTDNVNGTWSVRWECRD
jgi:hypothetical protein